MNFRKILLALALTNLIAFAATGQTKEFIQSDRPGFANSTFAVGQGVFQFQAGGNYVYSQDNSGKTDSASDDYLGEVQLRFGISENTEIFGSIGFTSNRTILDEEALETSGVSDLDLGLRVNMFDSEGWVPSASIIAELKMNKYEGDFGLDRFAPRLLLATTKNPTDFFQINTNIGIEWDGLQLIPSAFYVLNLSLSASDKIGFFAENYGSLQDEDLDSGFNAGLVFLPGTELQFDLSGGFARNDGTDSFLSSFGISWRIGS